MFDRIYSDRVDLISLDQVVDPSVEGIDDVGVLSIEVRHSIRKPAYSRSARY